jgi:hypothetical protein
MRCGFCGAHIELDGRDPPLCPGCGVPAGRASGLTRRALSASVGKRVRVRRRAPGGGEGGRVLGRLEAVTDDGFLRLRLTATVVAVLHAREVVSVEEMPDW